MPPFLSPKKVPDPILLGWAEIVHGYWSQLVRCSKEDEICDEVKCESSYIPMKHPFVIPGGRFRGKFGSLKKDIMSLIGARGDRTVLLGLILDY